MSRVLVGRDTLRRFLAYLERRVGPRRKWDREVSLLVDELRLLLERRER